MTGRLTLTMADFWKRRCCPYCGSSDSLSAGHMTFMKNFRAPCGRAALDDTARKARELRECQSCHLFYHRLVPTKQCLQKLRHSRSGLREGNHDLAGRALRSRLDHELLKRTQCRVLDIGCYTGGFLSLLPETWEKYGIDADAWAIRKARQNLPQGYFEVGYIEDTKLLCKSFDLITMWDVAEHLTDVKTAFENIASMLAPGGFLVVETGDKASVPARICRASWYYFNFLEHLVFFTPQSLGQIMKDNGFVVRDVRRTLHHKDQRIRRGLKTCAYIAVTLGGTFASPWHGLARALGKEGSCPMIPVRDHFVLTARKTAS